MKIVIAPDSFKGCMTASQAAIAIEMGIKRVLPRANCTRIAMADGGEGTVQALVDSIGGKFHYKKVTGPAGKPVRARYGFHSASKTAVIEMAEASGLHLVHARTRNPMKTTSFGTGELIVAALEKGAKKIVIGLGGSATVDAGMGMAQALGVKFLDKRGQVIQQPGSGGILSRVRSIDLSNIHPAIKKVDITIASDVTNPLYGKQGAAYIYGVQKGATPAMLKLLDDNLRHFHRVVARCTAKDLKTLKGAGAAGGLGYALTVFTRAKVKSGIDQVAELVGLKNYIAKADMVITGEGRIDSQTAFGKTPAGVAKIAKRFRVPVVAIGGSLSDDSQLVFKHGIYALESTIAREICLQDALRQSKKNLINAAERAMRLIVVGQMICKRKK